MNFDEKQLKPHAEPVDARKLREGEVYFSLNFVDDEMLLPELRPMVFVGRNLEPGDIETVYFQDIDSYRLGARQNDGKSGEEAVIESGSEKEVSHIFEFEHALDVLMACAIRRRNRLDRS